jgi:hypothetical protein
MLSRGIKIMFSLAVMVSFTGCATSVKYVSPTYVSPVQNQHYYYGQIQQELTRTSSTEQQMAGQQGWAANKDGWAMGVGMVVFW